MPFTDITNCKRIRNISDRAILEQLIYSQKRSLEAYQTVSGLLFILY